MFAWHPAAASTEGHLCDTSGSAGTDSAAVKFLMIEGAALSCRAKDAQYAWRKMDGMSIDGRRWKVDYATKVQPCRPILPCHFPAHVISFVHMQRRIPSAPASL